MKVNERTYQQSTGKLKVWSASKSHKVPLFWRVLFSVFGILIISLGLTGVSNVLLWQNQEMNRKLGTLFVVIMITFLIVSFSFRLGRMIRNETVFFCWEEEDDLLFTVNARDFSFRRGDFISILQSLWETTKNISILEANLQNGNLPQNAEFILQVESIKERKNDYALRCLVRRENTKVFFRTYLLGKGYDREEELLRMLERRRTMESRIAMADIPENKNKVPMIISGAVFLTAVFLCILSHPAIGYLTSRIYFPMLGITQVCFVIVLYFILKNSRGE